jgi:uncharacterized protein YkuJ
MEIVVEIVAFDEAKEAFGLSTFTEQEVRAFDENGNS